MNELALFFLVGAIVAIVLFVPLLINGFGESPKEMYLREVKELLDLKAKK